MKELPILFSTDMVQAILAGRKTQTRRVVKKIARLSSTVEGTGKILHQYGDIPLEYLPYGKPGDLLWVRETFQFFLADPSEAAYYASENEATQKHVIWKPSIHMPKSVARIWMQVEEIGVERLHDISEEDAIAEGMEIFNNDGSYRIGNTTPRFRTTDVRKAFIAYVNVLSNIKMDTNPWVWVVKFKVLSTTGWPELIQKLETQHQ